MSVPPSLPALFVDIDGVLAFQPEGLILAVNARFGTSHIVAEADQYPFFATLPPQQQSWAKANRAVIAANLAPDTFAIRVVRKVVKAGGSVTVCTERPPVLAALTRAWLSFQGVPGADDVQVVGPGGKVALLEPYGPGDECVLIDDDPGKKALVRPGVQVWQPARPYNSGDGDVWRFTDWRDVKVKLGLA